MAEIVDKYILDTKDAQKNLQDLIDKSAGAFNKFKRDAETYENQIKKAATTSAQVGANLTKQYNGLNLAVGQFARELPNAAISAQTFFISISNQVGQLQDSLSRIVQQNKELAAQGLKGQNIFKALGSAIFSVSSLLSIGATLLVVYGKELGNLISSIFKSRDAFNAAKEQFKALNEALSSKEFLSAITTVEQMKVSIDLAKKGFLDKDVVLLKYNETLGKSLGLANSLNEAEELTIKNGGAYIGVALNKMAAQISLNRAAELSVEQSQKILEREQSIAKQRKALDREEQVQISNINRGSFKVSAERAEQQRLDVIERFAKKRKELTDESLNEEIVALENNRNEQLRIATQFEQKALAIAQKRNINPDPVGTEALKRATEKAEKEAKDAAEEAIKQMRRFWQLYELEAEKVRPKGRLGTGLIPSSNGDTTFSPLKPSSFPASTFDVTAISNSELLDRIFEARKNKESELTAFLEAELKRRVDNAEAAAEKEKKINELVTRGAMDLAQSLANGIFQTRAAIEQEGADQRIERLEEERDQLLENDKLTAEQREQIQEDFERKRAEVLNRNAEVQRRIDLSQILVNTALAVIRALATASDPITGQILAGLAAAEGAIQYGIAASQPLPRFAQGTDRVRGGVKGFDSVHALLMPDEAVIQAQRNLEVPGLARAWNSGRLDQFLAMNYIEPALAEISEKQASRINNTFINNNRGQSMNDKRIVSGLKENAQINKLMLREMRKKDSGYNIRNRRHWN